MISQTWSMKDIEIICCACGNINPPTAWCQTVPPPDHQPTEAMLISDPCKGCGNKEFFIKQGDKNVS